MIPIKSTTLKTGIEQYCKLRGLSALTLNKHWFNLKVFCGWLGRKEFNKENLRAFVLYLQDKGWKQNTINSAVSTLKILSQLLYDQGFIENDLSNCIKSVKVGPFNPTLLTLSEVEAIINCPRTWGKYHKWIDRRKFDFFFEFLARCGLRRNEAINLKSSDFDFESGIFKVIGKGNKLRTIPIPTVLGSRLYLWLFERKVTPEGWVFAGQSGGRAGISTFKNELKKRLEILGINKRVNLHLFRHSWITEAIKANLPTDKIMKISGHSSFQTHLRYTHLVGEDCKDTMDNHPLNIYPQKEKSEQLVGENEKPSPVSISKSRLN